MSNIKQIDIAGQMTFDASPGVMQDGVWHDLGFALGTPIEANLRQRTDDALRLLGQIGLPTIGLEIVWKGEKMVENQHGGQMAMMGFVISGSEAWSFNALREAVKILSFVGVIESAWARDVENDEEAVELLEKEVE